jgi:hypothetical protein
VFSGWICDSGGMSQDAHQSLIADTVRFIKENFAPHEVLLSSSANCLFFKESRPAPVQAKVQPKVQPEMQVPKPLPVPPPPKKSPVIVAPPPEVAKKSVVLEKPAPPVQATNDEWKQLLGRLAPHLALSDQIPDDKTAQKLAGGWKTHTQVAPVVLLSFGEKGEERAFLDNLAKAIEQKLKPAKVVDAKQLEQEKTWDLFLESDLLKWILAPADFRKWPQLMQHYREIPAKSECYLEKVPLLVLSPFADYFKNPALKKDLWQTLCSSLSS